MSSSWNWPGSRWWRVDLHTHSPASYDFKPDADRVAQNWTAWVSAAKNARLQAVGLTDHNTPQGIDGIQAAAVAEGLIVFPGVEVTVGGIHLLCLFDAHCGRDDVLVLLAQLGIKPADYDLHDTTASKSIVEAIEVATTAGAIVIAAHVNGPKGLLKELGGEERLKALRAPGLVAAELGVPLFDAPGWMEEAEVRSWFDGSKPEGRLALIGSSDSHGFEQAGRRFTWMKMTRLDAEGLRLALLDGADSLKIAGAADPRDPNLVHADYAIESISVSHAKHMGQKEPLTIEFNPWLNAIIGGRGTGKSTLVDLCRKTLRRDKELKEGEGSLRAAFERRMRVPANRSEEGLLRAETLVELIYRKDGESFVLSWDPQGSTTPIARLDSDERVPDAGDIRERFPVRIYSQKQLFDLAKDPDALLTVIDDSTEVQSAELERSRSEAEAKYLSLCAEVRALRTQVAELPARTATLADVRRKLALLERGGHAKTLNDYRVRRRQHAAWKSIRKLAGEAVEAVGLAADERLIVADLDLGQEAESDPTTASLKRAHEHMSVVVRDLRVTVLAEVEKARTAIAAVTSGPDARAWFTALETSDQEYKRVTQELTEEGISNPDQYRDLIQRAAALELELNQLEKLRLTAEERETQATESLERYRHLREQLTNERRQFATKTSGDLIQVEILGFAQSDGVEAFLRGTLGVDRFDGDIQALGKRIVSGPIQPFCFDGLDELVKDLRELIEEPGKPWPTNDKRFETLLRKIQPERIDRLALYLPADAVAVRFRDPHNGTKWQPLAQGSPGQQTAALLAFVLGYGQEPIILDQPEDDLDNTLIYQVLVQHLRRAKLTRQVIVVTHNPNIVVHGDAELVVSLEAVSDQTKIVFAGGLQEKKAREEICRVMEGGPEAFETRYRRVMLPGGRRDG